MNRYRELYKILTDPATVDGDADDGLSRMPYDELCEWCVGKLIGIQGQGEERIFWNVSEQFKNPSEEAKVQMLGVVL